VSGDQGEPGDPSEPEREQLAEDAQVRPLSGIDLARSALARAREEARARHASAPSGGSKRRRPAGPAPARRQPGDPELLGETLARLLVDRGWDVPAAAVGVTERWKEIAGADLADHCKPDKFEDGVLSLVAESTAWATQVRLLVPTLHKRMEAVVGSGVVTRIEVRGPTRPDWRRGPLRVRGPGPRDTYG
jgi:predicted nucleic acid-binding Zn ribbon protein